MKQIALALTVLLAATLLLALPAVAQQTDPATVYFYRDGEAVPVTRRALLSGASQADAEALLQALVTGPTPDEQTEGLVSPLPPGTELLAVTVSGDEVTVDLRLPSAFLRSELDAYRSDAIVDQVVKTVHPLGLDRVHVRAQSADGSLLPISEFLPRPIVPRPTPPPNSDLPTAPAGPAPEHVGQPPIAGQGRPQGALSGKTVWLSAGHGWYWSDLLKRWNTQRPNCYGIVEDFSNAEAVNYYLARYLWNAGADVWLVRERSMNTNEVIVDNEAGAPGYAETGTWYDGSSEGYDSGGYRYAVTQGTATSSATWTPDLPQAGWYAVWAWFRHGSNRVPDAHYQIRHAGGLTEVRVSQEVHGQTWRYLGEFYFEAGTSGYVRLLDDSAEDGKAVVADAIRFGGGLGSIPGPKGTSGKPRWEEDASLWAQYQGAPTSVYTNDVTARPLYAEWETAKGYPGESGNAVYISWHTNAGGGTGTNSYIHDTDPTPGSAALQDWLHSELVSDLRAAWNPAWVDRGQKSADFGEVRELSTMPGVLLEVAFHDTEDPGDADDLRQPLFRQIAARAVYQGVVKYFADRDGQAVHLLPEPPTRLVARNSGVGQVTLSWAPPPWGDGVVGDAATSYKVYHSSNGHGFDDGTVVSDTALAVTGLAPRSLHFFRVTALNEGGESFPTPVVAVRTPLSGGRAEWLMVDGFDRLDEAAMIPQWESSALGTARRMFLERMNRYDYAVEHGQALDSCGRAFDGALNEAVVAGDVALATYGAVDWFVGEEAAADGSLSDGGRALLAAYLEGGGRLLLSGSEIGYDLVDNGRDPYFYEHYLRAAYRGDDADTYDFVGLPGGPFAGLVGRFDDSSYGTYNVDLPDRLGATGGSSVVLSYSGGTGDGAAVAYSGAWRLVYFGFPLETITDAATRSDLFCAAADYLLPLAPAGLSLAPDHRTGVARPGQTAVYSHTLTNTGAMTDTFVLTHGSRLGWAVSHPSALTLSSGQAATLIVSVTVPPGARSGTVERTILTATSVSEPGVLDTVVETTTVESDLVCTPRLINPGFEGGEGQSAWLVSPVSGTVVFVQRDDLPEQSPPYAGDWLARLGPVQPVSGSLSSRQALTQVVALPSGEPTATLSLAWFVEAPPPTVTLTDTLRLGLYDLSGTLQTELLSLTNRSPAGNWYSAEFDVSTFAGQVVQVAFRATTSETAFLLDEVQLTTRGRYGADEIRALWVDAYHDGIKSRQQIDELVETARAGSFNALVVQVRRRGDTYYPSAIDPWAPDADPTFDALAYLITQAHAAGIEVHAWIATLPIWSASAPPPPPSHVFNRHGPGVSGSDYWLMTRDDGAETADETYFLDPGHPEVVEYLVAVAAELASNYDLDGLHLDRVRYPWRDWGYNPTSVARFQALTGGQAIPDADDPDWLQWRRDQVSALLRRIFLTVHAINPRLRLSAALSARGNPPLDEAGWQGTVPYSQHLQDWRGWLAEGSLDLALPMIYRDHDSHASQFTAWSEWASDHQYGRGLVVGTGLLLNDVADSMNQFLVARQPSAQGHTALGMSGYSYATTNDEGAPRRDFVNAAVSQVFTRSAQTPLLPWLDAPALGHLMGTLTPTLSCLLPLDGQVLTLTGPQSRTLVADGSGWFGAIDLPPGDYVLSSGVLTAGLRVSQPLSITAGLVTEQPLLLECPSARHQVYLPLIRKAP